MVWWEIIKPRGWGRGKHFKCEAFTNQLTARWAGRLLKNPTQPHPTKPQGLGETVSLKRARSFTPQSLQPLAKKPWSSGKIPINNSTGSKHTITDIFCLCSSQSGLSRVVGSKEFGFESWLYSGAVPPSVEEYCWPHSATRLWFLSLVCLVNWP